MKDKDRMNAILYHQMSLESFPLGVGRSITTDNPSLLSESPSRTDMMLLAVLLISRVGTRVSLGSMVLR
jgi:hypothetical protein